MRFKTDENVHPDVAAWLRERDFAADTVWDEGLDRQSDSLIAQVIRRESRAFITFDVGFCDIRTYPPSDYSGIVVLRISTQDRESQLAAVARVLSSASASELAGALFIVEDRRVRVRRSS